MVRIADDQEYSLKLKEKLQEEVKEYLQSDSLEELVDIMEVIYALASHHNHSKQDLEHLQTEKALHRGQFKNRIILEEIKE